MVYPSIGTTGVLSPASSSPASCMPMRNHPICIILPKHDSTAPKEEPSLDRLERRSCYRCLEGWTSGGRDESQAGAVTYSTLTTTNMVSIAHMLVSLIGMKNVFKAEHLPMHSSITAIIS